MRVAVVTPTIGGKHLNKCLDSVQDQTYQDLVHYVFIDGKDYDMCVKDNIFASYKNHNIETISLSDNIGKDWYGHRVYAACSFLVNADVICYLDEDNWLDNNHIESVVETINKGNDWVYSLRKIYSKDGVYICDDDCESLGKWPIYFDDVSRHIDTSCFAVRRDIAVQIGHAWYGQWGADRQFFGALHNHFKKYDCTYNYTLNYRLDGNPGSVGKDFFDHGNKINFNRYNGKFPWRING